MSDDRPRAVIVAPGRGSYAAASLVSLPADHGLVRRAEELRAGYGLEPLLDLDRATRFDPVRHLRAANAGPLTLLATLLDVEAAADDLRVVAATGNSLGWYSALAIAGALNFDDAFRLVQEVGILQERTPDEGGAGGQVIYPLAGADWEPSPDLRAVVADATAETTDDGRVFESVDLGGYLVLAGDDAGIDRLVKRLPPVQVGERIYPLRLALHGPYHTPLVAHVVEAARAALRDLEWWAPRVTLIDGRGARWTPWSTDADALRDYTLGEQLTTPFRFATAVRVALRELAPDLLLLPGPGTTLGNICGQAIVREGYRRIRDRAAFEEAQAGDAPLIVSMRR